ncbi:MAG: phosphoenolpyruvate synthase [Flavobacteriales bacterium]|nr:phosphoenolpyruvate synthase [Flavobacteriia bacterium]NCP05370.1 phosphoenolpyruvate synthase [Flavobacteriales bacterium]PIV92559.1 MAG: phosphoenolpyruvate synthase [Flavobacteriaceae bacterium CG17_big_fil_post_rev_8_21_14_2_50_33_15]PIY12661.1 MAG: phosphoenolpyruvate synthase [Flavobacteriaceae bacterium CG_4_10_14_3_um_filter_33_47]PJB18079.1 MAG: phosphoenolpyruvate synthase [Flavobacteriaceae bacterium CG_4_9_14_3_um_filter_33_16]
MFKNPLPDLRNYEFEEVAFNELMQNRINKVLIVCSNYDYYMLEEDGRIDERIFNEYTDLNLRYPPNFIHANSAKRAIKQMHEINIDLVITWLDIGNFNAFETSKEIKKAFPEIPIAALSFYSSELRSKLQKGNKGIIDFVFHWNGNVDIFLAIIKLTEDRMNANRDINQIGVKAILMVEDSLKFYSRYLPIIYKILLKQTHAFMSEGLNEHRRMMLMRGRPKMLLATTYEEGLTYFEKYKSNLLGVISDVNYFKEGKRDPNAGFEFLKYVRSSQRYFPFLIQSSDKHNEAITLELKGKFLYKHSETLGTDLKNYITKYFSFGDFEFWDPVQMKVLAVVKDLSQFQKALKIVTLDAIEYHAKRSEYSKWLKSRALFPLANLFSKVEFDDFQDIEQIRDYLIEAIKVYRVYRSRGVIVKFDKDKYDEYLGFARIGDGALGGKGRGLAFIDSFLKRHKLFDKFDTVHISIPRTVVLSTEVFDEFIEKHDLIRFAAQSNDDEEILKTFISKPLPNWVLEDIKVFLSVIKRPIAVRSSSVLEDSHFQPFAGVFATYMIPNTNNVDMLNMVSNAIKSVMASAFFQSSKAYLKLTSHTIEEDKMAVILQELTGKTYGDVYYPNISGVARSINFYPVGDENPSEGVANIALGLGEIIVGGGQTLRFSPYHPKKVLQLSSPGSSQRDTQQYFYGLDLDPKSYKVSINESINKKKFTLREAKNHSSLKYVASTYDLQNNIIRPGVLHDGLRVITFDNVLKYNTFPLPEILQDLLRIGQREMRNPIEIEFAVNLDVAPGTSRIFSFLQIRPIVESIETRNELPEDFNVEDTIIYSQSALGNGTYGHIKDFVYIKPETFNPANTRQIALAVEQINKKFEEQNKQYILVGPGRWGSSDSWLGIPVIWSQISSAKIIVEAGLNDFRIDPSQGTHFFQNLTSFKVGYFTINPFINDGFFDLEYLNKQDACFEDDYLRHICFKEPLTIVIEGKSNKAAIFKEGFTINKNHDFIENSMTDLPPGGFM